ncbi:MAG: hypothetical protein HRK26_04985 [Rickettsiaceae bacterium H1]|nr:hypothetical protein [Rickettsiaceae bacterium H1]
MIKNIESLWRAVILQAVIDAKNNYKRKEYQLEKEKARSWLLNLNNDFISVCIMAGCDPRYVQAKAKNVLDNHKAKQQS